MIFENYETGLRVRVTEEGGQGLRTDGGQPAEVQDMDHSGIYHVVVHTGISRMLFRRVE